MDLLRLESIETFVHWGSDREAWQPTLGGG